MVNSKIYEAKTLISAMEERGSEYENFRNQLGTLKKNFASIIELDDAFQGKGAEAIKGFFQAQVEVVDAWIQLIDVRVAFFKGISGSIEDVELSGDTIVQIPFLQDELGQAYTRSNQLVSAQQDDLQKIFDSINDLVPLEIFSRDAFDEKIDKAEQKRKNSIEQVHILDHNMTSEYESSESAETYLATLFGQLLASSSQGGTISPLYFDAKSYHNSEVYQLKDEAEKQKAAYLTFKKDQAEARIVEKEIEAQEQRPWYEKAWDGVTTFTGEVTGYYDSIRAAKGIDPVTGRKLSNAERVTAAALAAAGFIPVVGWAGRAFKGGSAIYKTAKGMNAANHALDTYKTAESFKILEQTEAGVYGLISANGLFEASTGKDMFGNQLTEEQQKQSLYQALGILGVAGAARYMDRKTSNGLKLPYSNGYAKAKVEEAQQILKDLGKKVGNVEVPVGARVYEAAGYGINAKVIEVQKKTINELKQEFSLKSVGAGETGKTTMGNPAKGNDVKKASDISDDIIKDGSHINISGKLKPNIKYQAGEYDYQYKTDEFGRLTEFNADDLKLTKRDNRLPHKSNTPGKESGDHAGHLAADRFGGSPDLDNLVSQSSSVNLSIYKKLENHWAKAIDEGKNVSVNVKVNYEGNGLRPSSFDIEYEIDGRMRFTSIEN
ncbi:transposase [Peribacillus cavernae]|uniref:Transposase n=1 Tax=Peribacillus cavernae TaxID=1674310 RepID=A0A3S1B1H0_9BACI|nr:T7SS effector LXG polymorphic toxin [Peribacillus cavernae]MDQ0221035.1 putative ribonuclease toxin of YeeF-YezG toxin-antitoxin module [Peribacillus cavernae]RUQ25811.1 transposase [Peribacillus cavernae]